MIELERFVTKQLEKLPKNHPDRKEIRKIAAIVKSWNAKNKKGEKLVEVKRFSQEASFALEKAGYLVYVLGGQSVKSWRQEGRKFRSTWHQSFPQYEALTSENSEVAINPDPAKFFLPESNKRTLAEQLEMIDQFSLKLTQKVKDVAAIMGEMPDYVELAFTHLTATGQKLFGEKYDYNYTRTKTPTSGSFTFGVGCLSDDYGLDIDEWRLDEGYSFVFASPLIVPK